MEKVYDIASEDARSFTRMKPAVYCGDTTYPNQLLVEYLSNVVDEHVIGNGNECWIEIRKNGDWVIKDQGQGIPCNQFYRKASIDEEERYKNGSLELSEDQYKIEDNRLYIKDDNSTLERSFSVINSSGKYSEDGVYNGTSLGSFGIGSKLGTWLSNYLTVSSMRNGEYEVLKFVEGRLVNRQSGGIRDDSHGVQILFHPSDEFFTHTELDEESFLKLLKETSYLCPNFVVHYLNEMTGTQCDVQSEKGLVQCFDDLKLKEFIKNRIEIRYSKESEKRSMNMIITFTEGYSGSIVPYVNYGLTESGTHISAVKECITRTFNKFARDKMMLKEDEKNLTGDQIQEGMYCMFNLVTPNVKYDAQVKSRVTNRDLAPFINESMTNTLEFWIKQNDKDARKIIEKALLARKAQEAAKKARDKTRKEKTSKISFDNKLSDCTSNNPEECEIYIVEGDSAGGSAKTARNRATQAILPLRGKILNVDKADDKKILLNNEICSMVKGFGCGVGKDFDISKLRYNKIIIMTDADVDGSHISTLLLTFFYRYMPELIKQGYVYCSIPPLFGIKTSKGTVYLKDEKELEQYQQENKGRRYQVSRYKGLGEMDAEELWETTMNPENRRLKRITLDDFDEKTDNLITTLMGTDVGRRRKFIIANSEFANLDI